MGSYLLLYIIVAIVSLISSIHFFDLAHQGWMSIVLACSFELGQMACLFGALTRRKREFDIVWIMFVVLTLFQCMANTYAAYVGLTDYISWSELFGLTEMEPIDQKRIIAGISGAILPLIALGFIKCLTDYLNENDKTNFENNNKSTISELDKEDFDEEDRETMTELVGRRKPKKTPKEFDGFVMSDDDVKKLENYGRNGVSSSKKDMENSLSELKEQSNG